MAVVNLISSPTSYGAESTETIYDSAGTRTLPGYDFGDLETGQNSHISWFYFRHDGTEEIYNVGAYIRSIGTEWGGYVASADSSYIPYNPNWFRSGGVDENDYPQTSTEDYNFMREQAFNNPEKGMRLHTDRNNPTVKTNGLGYQNEGLSFSPKVLPVTTLDYSSTSNPQLDGVIYPEPIDSSQKAQAGDEAKMGVSLNISTDVVGSGVIQFSLALKYRYTQ